MSFKGAIIGAFNGLKFKKNLSRPTMGVTAFILSALFLGNPPLSYQNSRCVPEKENVFTTRLSFIAIFQRYGQKKLIPNKSLELFVDGLSGPRMDSATGAYHCSFIVAVDDVFHFLWV